MRPSGPITSEADAPDSIPYALHQVSEGDIRAVAAVLRSGRLAQGPEVERFEAALARATSTRFAVGVSSGTAALHVALSALGVGPGDEVIVPSLTFLATANAVLFCGARPVFADVDPETLTLSPEAVAAATTPRTRGAVTVHFAGHPSDVPGLRNALGRGRFLVEDACHALGATLEGRDVGSLADAACFSFHPAKHVTTGEGGAVTTDDANLAWRVRMRREHGVERRRSRFEGLGLGSDLAEEERGPWVYEMHELAPNYRLAEIGAALGRHQLGRLGAILDERRATAAVYTGSFAGCDAVELPAERCGARSAWHLYPVRLRLEALGWSRARVFRALRQRGIGVQVHYIPVHLQPYYRKHLGTALGDLPVTEAAYLRLLSLPLFAGLRDEQVARVVEAFHDVIGCARR